MLSPFPVQVTLPRNSKLTTALTLTPGLKRDEGLPLSVLKAQGPSRPLASQREPSSYPLFNNSHFHGTAPRYFTSLRNRAWLHRSNRFQKIVCRDLSDVEGVL